MGQTHWLRGWALQYLPRQAPSSAPRSGQQPAPVTAGDPTQAGQQVRLQGHQTLPGAPHRTADCPRALLRLLFPAPTQPAPSTARPRSQAALMYVCHISDWGRCLSKLANYSNCTFRLFPQLPSTGDRGVSKKLSAVPFLPPRRSRVTEVLPAQGRAGGDKALHVSQAGHEPQHTHRTPSVWSVLQEGGCHVLGGRRHVCL